MEQKPEMGLAVLPGKSYLDELCTLPLCRYRHRLDVDAFDCQREGQIAAHIIRAVLFVALVSFAAGHPAPAGITFADTGLALPAGDTARLRITEMLDMFRCSLNRNVNEAVEHTGYLLCRKKPLRGIPRDVRQTRFQAGFGDGPCFHRLHALLRRIACLHDAV